MEGDIDMEEKGVSFLVVLAAAAAAAAAAPVATVAGVSVDDATHAITVSYMLDAPAIVTADFLTNGVSIGEGNFRALSGDVNRYVADVSQTRSFVWQPGADGDWTGGLSVQLTAWSTNCPPDYMAIDLVATNQIWFYVSEAAIPLGLQHAVYKSSRLLMRKIPAADVTFCMGSPTTESYHKDSEAQHLVKLTNDFYIGVFPVTQRQWKTLTKRDSNSSHTSESKLPDHWLFPANAITYNSLRGKTDDGIDWPTTARFEVSAGSYLQAIRTLTGISTMDLPTEAEWEYACRAGTSGPNYNGATVNAAAAKEIGWYLANSPVDGTKVPHPVGLKKPNAWGLYDMLGNMHEWCIDWRGDYEFDDPSVATVAPTGPRAGTYRVKRGGASYEHDINFMRSAIRDSNEPSAGSVYNGVRLYCSVPVDP